MTNKIYYYMNAPCKIIKQEGDKATIKFIPSGGILEVKMWDLDSYTK